MSVWMSTIDVVGRLSWDAGTWDEMSSLITDAAPARRILEQATLMFDYLIVGAGFAGSVMAERLAADAGKKVLIIDKRNHVGGNAYDHYDDAGVLVHKYGPHIFHTNSREVFEYLSRFTEWRQYQHRVQASVDGQLLPIPINLATDQPDVRPQAHLIRAQ